jgi:K+-transporting ATPase KdpF subunit
MILNFVLIMLNTTDTQEVSGYMIAGVLALVILGYLIYSLIKPEKF